MWEAACCLSPWPFLPFFCSPEHMILFSHLTLWSICAAKKKWWSTCAIQALGGIEFGRLLHSSLQSPATPINRSRIKISYQSVKILVKTQQVSKLTFVFRLPVDEHTLKLQLLFELLDIGQLHIRAGWKEIKTLQMNEKQPVWRGLWRRGRSVSASGRHRHHGRAES